MTVPSPCTRATTRPARFELDEGADRGAPVEDLELDGFGEGDVVEGVRSRGSEPAGPAVEQPGHGVGHDRPARPPPAPVDRMEPAGALALVDDGAQQPGQPGRPAPEQLRRRPGHRAADQLGGGCGGLVTRQRLEADHVHEVVVGEPPQRVGVASPAAALATIVAAPVTAACSSASAEQSSRRWASSTTTVAWPAATVAPDGGDDVADGCGARVRTVGDEPSDRPELDGLQRPRRDDPQRIGRGRGDGGEERRPADPRRADDEASPPAMYRPRDDRGPSSAIG